VILTNWDFALFTQNDLSLRQNCNTDVCGTTDPVVIQVIDPVLVHFSHYWVQFVIQLCGSFCDNPQIFHLSNSLNEQVYKERHITTQLVHRAEDAGYSAIVLTVDTPRLGRREADLKNKSVFKLSQSLQTPPQNHPAKMNSEVFDS